MTEKEQDTAFTQEELDRMADEFVTALLSEIQSITPEEIAKRGKAEPADTDILIPFVPTETEHLFFAAQGELNVIRDSSLDTRHDMKLSFPPSDYSKTNDPVSRVYEACYRLTDICSALILQNPPLRDAIAKAVTAHGITAENAPETLKQEWDILSVLLSLPDIAKITKKFPAYEDFNQDKSENRSLLDAKRKTEHIRGGKLVKKVSIETGGGIEEDGNPIPLDVADTDDFTETTTERFFDEQALAALNDTEQEIMRRRRQGETYATLARDFGYKSAGGMQKRVARIQAKMEAVMNPRKS